MVTDAHLSIIFASYLRDIHWQRIETGLTGRGIPDTNGCFQGTEFWIEFKRANHWRVSISAEQIGWIERRLRAGGRVFVAVRRKQLKVDELYLFNGSVARQFPTTPLPLVIPLGRWEHGPKAWDWAIIRNLLIGR